MLSAWATATLDGNIFTFNVESGEETYSNALTSSIEGIVKGPGTICIGEKCAVTFMGSSAFDDNIVFENVADGTIINMWNRASPVPCELKATADTTFKMGRGRDDGEVWLLAVNSTYKPKVVEFLIAGSPRNQSVSLEPLGVWFGKIEK